MKASPQDVFGYFDSQKYKRPSLNVHEFPFLEFSHIYDKLSKKWGFRLSDAQKPT